MLALLLAGAAAGQGIEPRERVEDYPAHGQVSGIQVGAEFQYRGVPAGRDSLYLREGLVVEVALYGPKGRRYQISPGHFSLRINRRDPPLMPQSPGTLVYAEKYGRQKQLDIGLNGGVVVLGGPERGPRFPGDATGQPRNGRVPPSVDTGLPRRAGQDPAAVMERVALPNASRSLPTAGCVYFHYVGKTQKIKHLELFYNSAYGTLKLKLK